MKPVLAVTLIVLILFGCTNHSSDNIKSIPVDSIEAIYRLTTDPRTKLTLKKDHRFEYVNIKSKNYIDDWFYVTRGTWKLDSDRIVLNSTMDSLVTETVNVKKEMPIDSNTSRFSFFDAYNDSVGYWYVTYPDGRMEATGFDLQDANYWWRENMKKYKTLEFRFTGYKPWRCISDGQNYNYRVYLYPLFKPNIFRDAIFLKKGDSLIEAAKSADNIFKMTL